MIGLNMNDESFYLLLNKHFIPIDPNSILFDDLWFVDTLPPISGCMDR